ncbi:MAG: T9SS type A sorting domain-containing protein [Bacteroidetes bacterium]|nr:T9SS type A sorting domain-containing protein [Bacteroidota bacterium]
MKNKIREFHSSLKTLQQTNLFLICHLLATVLFSVNGTAQTLIFKNGFEGTSRVEYKDAAHDLLRGSDNTSTVSDWYANLEKNPYINFGQITYEQGDYSQRKAEIVSDPAGGTNKVLRYRITDQHILMPSGERKARIQYDLQNQELAPAGGYIKEYYQKVKLYFSPNFKVLEDSPTAVGWIIMHEFWNDGSWDRPNGTANKPTRVDFGLTRTKDAVGEKLRFDLSFRDPIMAYPANWQMRNDNFAIPLGTWMTQEIYVKEGDDQTGRVYMAITIGNVKTVIFDKIGRTCALATSTYTPDGQTSWNPMKIYMEGKVAKLFHDKGKTLDVYWDDLEVWFNRKPGVVTNLNNPEPFEQSKITLYPNPANDFVMIEGITINSQIELYNVLGEIVTKQTANSNTTKIDISELNQGIYFLKIIYQNDAVQTGKIIKQF